MAITQAMRSGPWAQDYEDFENYYPPCGRGAEGDAPNDYLPAYTKEARELRLQAAAEGRKRGRSNDGAQQRRDATTKRRTKGRGAAEKGRSNDRAHEGAQQRRGASAQA